MIISKTPFRISFFGGGTDYPEYFTRHGGAVLGTAIDKSTYVAVSPFYSRLFDYSIRLAYRQVECVNDLDSIQHAPFRECLRWTGIHRNVEIDYMAELPSSVGLGTSSSFVVGVLNSLYTLLGKPVLPLALAHQAIQIERDKLAESVGCQDQTFAAVGGFNLIEFCDIDDIRVHRVPISTARKQELQQHLLLLFTGIRRRASHIAARHVEKIQQNTLRLARMREMVDEGFAMLTSNNSLAPFGALLDEAWSLKNELDNSISNPLINDIYRTGREHGALGGKLLGAGAGGFMLFFVPPERRQAVRGALVHLEEIPIEIDAPGTEIIHSSTSDTHATADWHEWDQEHRRAA